MSEQDFKQFAEEISPHVVMLIPTSDNRVSIETARSVMEIVMTLILTYRISVEPNYINQSFYDNNRELSLNMLFAKYMSDRYGPKSATVSRHVTHFVVMDPTLGVTVSSIAAMLLKMHKCRLPILAAAVPTDRLQMMDLFTHPDRVFVAKRQTDDMFKFDVHLAKPSVDVGVDGVASAYSVQQQVGMHCTAFDVNPVTQEGHQQLRSHPREASIAYTTDMSTRFFIVQAPFLLQMQTWVPALKVSALTPIPPDWTTNAFDYFSTETMVSSDPRVRFSHNVKRVIGANMIPFDMTVDFAVQTTQYIKSANYAMKVMDRMTYLQHMEKHNKVLCSRVGPLPLIENC